VEQLVEEPGMSSETVPQYDNTANSYTRGSLGAIFVKTALPIIFVMSMNGLLAVVDAVFLGIYVGPDALGAVTLMFPLYILIVALATLVASGMSSQLARHLGAGKFDLARTVLAGAHGLALVISAVLIALYLAFGKAVTLLAAAGSVPLAEMGYTYLGISAFFSPVIFVLSVNSDALRNEGRVGLMAAMSLLVSLSNIVFNYVLIAELGLGVAGSAYGTAMAQILALAIIVTFRLRGRTELRMTTLLRHPLTSKWLRILALGAPQSLGFIGLALGSAAIIASLQMVNTPNYETTISAYGIVTRIMTFVFLPLLGLTHALQSIVGNNYGAELWRRSDNGLRLGLTIAFVYCLLAQILLTQFAGPIGRIFVDDAAVVADMVRIVPIIVSLFVIAGPLMMISTYFQAIGDAGRAAILSLTKPYAFAIPLTFLLPLAFGEQGIWLAGPTAEGMLLVLTVAVLAGTSRRRNLHWGLFMQRGEVVR